MNDDFFGVASRVSLDDDAIDDDDDDDEATGIGKEAIGDDERFVKSVRARVNSLL